MAAALASFAVALTVPGALWAAQADVFGSLQTEFLVSLAASLKTTSAGSACVFVDAGPVSNSIADPVCLIDAPSSTAGRGHDRAAFSTSAGALDGTEDGVADVATSTQAPGTAVATGSADWSSFAYTSSQGLAFGAWHNSFAEVTSSDASIAIPGHGVADARDPFDFSSPTSGTITYAASLADVQFKADATLARNRLSFRSTIRNVSKGGVALNGSLWTLDVTTAGGVTSGSSVVVTLTAWSNLGIAPASIVAAQAYVKAAFQPLGNGYVGFAGSLPLFGGGGPLPTITLDQAANTTVHYVDALTADVSLARAATVPGLSGMAAIMLALVLCSIATRWIRRASKEGQS